MAIIFFGISNESNISKSIDKWISIAGTPDIFAENDESLEHYQTKLLGKYDVVSIEEALRRYPEADVWVTYRKAHNTAKALCKKVLPQKIRFLEADLEYRQGCTYLGNFISYRKNNFSPCCIAGRCPVEKASGSIRQRLAHWQEFTTKLIDDIRNDKPTKCHKCHLLKYGFWRKSVKLNVVSFGSNQPGDVCNFKCVYCFSERTLEHLKKDNDGHTTYEILQQLSEMPEFDTEEFTMQFANGEFCANRHCDEMLDILLKSKWEIVLNSNCSIYKEKLATLMETGRIRRITTSLDSGTRETFKKIKQVDSFDRVVSNLKKYPMDKTRLLVKYIFLEGINDNEKDIEGFYEIVKEVGGTVMFSADENTNFAPYTENMRELTASIIKKAKADGVKIDASSGYLNPQDSKFIQDCYANA